MNSIYQVYYLTAFLIVKGIEGDWNWIHSKSRLVDQSWGENKPDRNPGNP